jgi:hypothetical protein
MDTEERLEKLERELLAEKRRNRWLLAAVGLGLVGVALAWTLATITSTAQAQGANIGPKVIRATQLILEDETGKPRAWLGVSKDGPMLTLVDENGKPRAMLSVRKDGPALLLDDETGKLRAALGVLKSGPGLEMLDENGKQRAVLSVSKDGPKLHLSDANGKVIWSQP